MNEFNATNGFPIIKLDDSGYVLFLYASLTEALYETPFYWLNGDKNYAQHAMKNRGAFTEKFCTERLQRVFGSSRVFQNVDIWESASRKRKLGEIDTLVLFGDRAIVVQAKSKKLTLAARKGNDLQLKADFKAAVQDACKQAAECSKYLLVENIFLSDEFGNEVKIKTRMKRINPICVVSDHYPALSFQAQEFLSYETVSGIERPLVCDVFFIDVVTEFLDSPLRFLSYLELRSKISDNIGLSHENVALGYHLRQNLWLGEYDYMMLHDDISVDVDIAMSARRDGVRGEKNPPGILTLLKGTAVGRIIDEIEARSEPGAIGTGLELLKLSGKTAADLSKLIDKIVSDAAKDGNSHDATIAIGREGSGFTVHCNALPTMIAEGELRRHCELRKYSSRAGTWFGLNLQPGDGRVRFGLMLDYPWKRDAGMDAATAQMPAPKSMADAKKILKGSTGQKVGRNDLCPCGSGLKYKRCHL